MTELDTIQPAMLTFCSIATPGTLASARVLTSGLRRAHPDARVIVGLRETAASVREDEPFETIAADALFKESQTPSGRMPLRPLLLQRALADGAELAVYLDPEVCVYSSLEPVLGLAREHGLVAARRVRALPEDGRRPDYSDLLAAGRISDGFVAVSRGQTGERFLRSWAQSLLPPDDDGGRWLELIPDLFQEAALLDDTGCNVSFWNLHERPLEYRGKDISAADRPLCFIHFSGFRPDRPYWLSEHANRVRVIDDPVLSDLCGQYAQAVRDAGWTPPSPHLGGVDRLGNGHRVDHLVRTLWRDALALGRDFGDPSDPRAADAFVAWIREPAEQGGGAGVNRYLLAAYVTRPDLQSAFPDLDGEGGQDLIGWAWTHGRLEILPELLPAAPEDSGLSEEYKLGVNVIGYLRETLGLAEAARLYINALTAAGVPVTTTAILPDMPVNATDGPPITRTGRQTYEELRGSVRPTFNLVCANGDQLEAFMRAGGERELGGRPTIGQWGWETDVLPQSWLPAFRHLDEIWVYTTFVAENLARLAPVPVVVVPMSISVPDVTGVELELACDERFTFVFMLDFFSTLRRKNALGLVDAFTRAFAPGEGPRLLIKTINAQFREQAADELRFDIGDRPDIELIDGYLEPLEKSALLAHADCYVSLHRSEGFGLPLAECMALGTPVIATGYSGNTDFMTPQNSYLVDWTPTRVGPDCDIYPAHGNWAEPDRDHAAELMRRVWERPEEAAAKAQRARADIARLYAPEVAGAIARARLERLMETCARAGTTADAGGTFHAIERELALDLRRGAPPVPGGAAGIARRLAFRLMYPFTFHERTLDRALFDAMRQVRLDLDRERERRRQDSSRLRGLEEALARRDADRPG
jgi:glycosyltransferase involved in cell wall biosynthesis